ncbi:VOC family protein [Paenibacillus nasutitermitis]|uniref:Glyoxalase-like domain-containing protein n=1 Tax=Paenibacillus nasutitermitis TaxID=1652958 RepID=A0A916YTL3_9BACL|nr:VOC family protein [Paenibacillus nasutitermitis]GGD60496.1 hypothetical protein GCM10010911_18000 [Paenibacillus nasutitermitis]
MNLDINILHHIGLITSNMNITIERYEKLGFSFTPLSLPRIPLKPGGELESLGVGNRCAIFQNNYLEVLGVVDKARWDTITEAQRGPYDIDKPLRRFEGLHVMHFGADDLEAVHKRLIEQGTSCSDIKPFQRIVDTPDGKKMMHAKTVHFPENANPEGLIQIAQHVTPELVLQPRYMQHANGAKTIIEIIVCTTNPSEYAAKYERYSGHKSEQKGSSYILNLGYSSVRVISPENMGDILPGRLPPALPFLAGFTVAVTDLHTTRNVLTDNQIPFVDNGERLIVRSEDACGSAVLFVNE